MKLLLKTIFGLLLIVSCAEEVIEKPDNLIAREKMTELLYDLAILDAAKSTNSAILEAHFDSPTSFLFKQYGVDSLQFVKSDLYYASQPLVYEAIYKEVEDRLAKEKEKVEMARKKANDSMVKRGKIRKDSLRMDGVN
jgi:hypothetical protein